MINLKLAEYKDGKFNRFLEQSKLESQTFFDQEGMDDNIDILSNGFLLGANYIQIVSRDKDFDICSEEYKLDEKDPLNRFDGLFDGRTYGEGRFVLIENNQDDIYKCQIASEEEIRESYRRDGFYTWENRILIGNLHENPELFLKI